MAKKQAARPAGKPAKIKRSYYLDTELWERLHAFAQSQVPEVTDSAVIHAALKQFLDERERKK
jgi:hypothetical protein